MKALEHELDPIQGFKYKPTLEYTSHTSRIETNALKGRQAPYGDKTLRGSFKPRKSSGKLKIKWPPSQSSTTPNASEVRALSDM